MIYRSKLDEKLVENATEDIFLIAENRQPYFLYPENYLDGDWEGQTKSEISVIAEIASNLQEKSWRKHKENKPVIDFKYVDVNDDDGRRNVVHSFVLDIYKAYNNIIGWKIFQYQLDNCRKFLTLDNSYATDAEFNSRFGGARRTIIHLGYLCCFRPLECFEIDEMSASYMLAALHYLCYGGTFSETISIVIPDFDLETYYFSDWFDKSVIKIFKNVDVFECFFDEDGEPYVDKHEYDRQFEYED